MLVRSEPRDEENLEGLRARVTALETLLGERAGHVARAKSDLEAFRRRYRLEVGLLHEQLDELELAIAEAELGELPPREDTGVDSARETPSSAPPTAPARYTSDAVRALFRDVARTIHPDLARDEVARDRRHALMVEANRAYVEGDEAQLRWILQVWERSPEAVQGTGPEAMSQRFVRRIAQIEEQLDALDGELATLEGSPLWSLKVMVDEAAARGKDLVRDMVGRLKRDIMVATNRLEAMRPPR